MKIEKFKIEARKLMLETRDIYAKLDEAYNDSDEMVEQSLERMCNMILKSIADGELKDASVFIGMLKIQKENAADTLKEFQEEENGLRTI